MKRTLSALMALIMLLGIVCTAIGCSDPVGGEETVTTTEAAVAESNIEEVTIRLFTDLTTDCESVHFRKHDIQQNQVRFLV